VNTFYAKAKKQKISIKIHTSSIIWMTRGSVVKMLTRESLKMFKIKSTVTHQIVVTNPPTQDLYLAYYTLPAPISLPIMIKSVIWMPRGKIIARKVRFLTIVAAAMIWIERKEMMNMKHSFAHQGRACIGVDLRLNINCPFRSI
jgi:hypothetical protein